MNSIPIIYSFARSGGTLINQLLGVHPQCLVLSEVNPAGSYKSVAAQALEWLKVLEQNEMDKFSLLPYSQQIKVIYERTAERGMRLIVRDWITINFLSDCAGHYVIPSRQLEQKLYLERIGFELLPLVVTRRSVSVFQSMKRVFPHLKSMNEENFANGYLQYARAVAKYPRIHMEDLRKNPEGTLLTVLRYYNLDDGVFENQLQSFHEFKDCTGNVTLSVSNDSTVARTILPPEEDGRLKNTSIYSHPDFSEADRLFGYV